jgi:tRNA (guanine-N7-)-methyltransferase
MSLGLARGRKIDLGDFGIESHDLPPFDHGRIDPRNWFDSPSNRLEIEIGTGKGTFLIQQAPRAPRTSFLGIEWTGEFFRFAADRMRRHGLRNVKILHADATEFIRFWCADAVAWVIHLYFSDPWPKKRHHKRRVIQDRALTEFHRVLAPGGELRLVTDHDELWSWYEDHASRHAELFDRREFASPDSAGEGEIIGTNYERKFAREGRPFHAMTLVRRPIDAATDSTSRR